jgi:hypothetical protein
MQVIDYQTSILGDFNLYRLFQNRANTRPPTRCSKFFAEENCKTNCGPMCKSSIMNHAYINRIVAIATMSRSHLTSAARANTARFFHPTQFNWKHLFVPLFAAKPLNTSRSQTQNKTRLP